jgi:hypothetical protein
MKTTLEIPDAIFRQVKARSALEGKTMKEFVLQAIRARLKTKSVKKDGWRSVYGKASAGSIAEVQEIIDREFSRIDLDDWK